MPQMSRFLIGDGQVYFSPFWAVRRVRGAQLVMVLALSNPQAWPVRLILRAGRNNLPIAIEHPLQVGVDTDHCQFMSISFASRRTARSVTLRTFALGLALAAAMLALTGSGGGPGPGIMMEPSSFRGGSGYWLLAKDGGVFAFGDAGFFGPNRNQGQDIAGMAATATGNGYWTVDDDGDVFAYGDAVDFGSRPGPEIDNITGFAARTQGDGYWMVARDGSVYAFGGAKYFGSANTVPLVRPIVGMAATPSGQGYWLIAGDGGVFAYGDAKFFGSTGNIRLSRPIVDFAPSPDGQGYRFIGSDGGVFAYGNAGFFGSTGAIRLNLPVVGFAGTASGKGYWLVAEDGGVFAFGDAKFHGSTGAIKLNASIVAIVATPRVKVAPVARDDTATTNEDNAVTIDVEANDTHALPATVSVETIPSKGTASVNDGKVVYTPNANANGSDSFKYTLTDSVGHSATATVTVTVTPVNDAPTISNVANQTTPRNTSTGPLAFSVGDVDTAGVGLTVSGSSSNTTLVPNGNIVFGGSGTSRSVAVTPAANQSGAATVTVTVADGAGGTATDSFVVTVNDRPTISDIGDQMVAEDTTTGALVITVGDTETAATSLTLSATSSNTMLAPNANIIFGGTGVNRTVTVAPAANQNGTATISVTVGDANGGTATDSFALTVDAVNDLPTISDVANQSTNEDTATDALELTVGDVETTAGSLTLLRASSNTALVPVDGIAIAGFGANRTVTVTPAANQSGTATITLTVSDGSGGTATDSFLLTVTAVNDLPMMSNVDNQTAAEDTATDALEFTVGDVETAVGSLTLSGSSSNTALVPNGNIVFGGSGANRTVTVTPAADQSGTATITLTVTDGNSGAAGDTFLLTVNAVDDPPTITAIGDLSIDQNGATLPLAFTIGDPDTPVGNLTVSGSSSDDSLVPDGNVVVAGTLASWTVTVTPLDDEFGESTITVRVSDGTTQIDETFVLTVGFDDQPVAVDDGFNVLSSVLTDLDVLANDSGLTNTALEVTIAPGTLVISEGTADIVNSHILLTANLVTGSFTFDYVVTDANGDFAVGTVTVDLGP